jgi:hypothetical protein
MNLSHFYSKESSSWGWGLKPSVGQPALLRTELQQNAGHLVAIPAGATIHQRQMVGLIVEGRKCPLHFRIDSAQRIPIISPPSSFYELLSGCQH